MIAGMAEKVDTSEVVEALADGFEGREDGAGVGLGEGECLEAVRGGVVEHSSTCR